MINTNNDITYQKINPIETAIILQFFNDQIGGMIDSFDVAQELVHEKDNRLTYKILPAKTGFGYMATMFEDAEIKYEFVVIEKNDTRHLFATVYHRYTHPDGGQNGYDASFIRKGDKLVKR